MQDKRRVKCRVQGRVLRGFNVNRLLHHTQIWILMQYRPYTSLAPPMPMQAGATSRLISHRHNYHNKDKAKDKDTSGQAGIYIQLVHAYMQSTTRRAPTKFVTQGLNPSVLNPFVRPSQSA
jgi:hypothetical protein